ncbi:MAG: helix-turn-helix domain-containing protein [Nannocystis sp.]|nr:helix-turn-helix domain-containing protein [Nannocystis sp.]
MTPDELAELLRCSRRTVYDRVDKGELPGSLRIGRRLYFMREIVLGSLLEGTERRSWRIQ